MQAYIFHGTDSTPDHFWFPYIKQELEKIDIHTFVPQLPDAKSPTLDKWLPFVLKYKYTEDTILIGHSAGSPLILSLLENLNVKVKLAVLVSGFVKPLDSDPEPILQSSYDFEKIKTKSQNFVFINSVNDPWGCDDKQGRAMFDKLGGYLVLTSDQGHMGSDYFNQPYKEFPLLLNIIKSFL